MTSMSLLEKVDRALARQVFQRPLPLTGAHGVISFTFDDAPSSACQVGKAILEAQACRGTWYIAGSLTDGSEMNIPCHNLADLRALHAAGHEIGCHTFSHRACRGRSAHSLIEDFQRNQDFLKQQLGVSPRDFAYPLGSFGLLAKRCAAAAYSSIRLTRPGIHVGQADLNGLLAQRLYHHDMTQEWLQVLINSVQTQRGWLIFYTHDVTSTPSPWGVTPDLLTKAIQLALTSGCKVLPIGQAIDYWQKEARC